MDFLGGRYHKSNFCKNRQERKFICANRNASIGRCDGFVQLTLNPMGLANENGPLSDFGSHAECCEFYKTNARLDGRFKNVPPAAGPAKRVVDCSTSSESIDALVAEGEKVVDKQHDQESESEEVVDEQQVDEENKTEFDEDYGNELNQNVFVLEVTLNKLNEIAPFVANKSIFRDKLLSCKRTLDTLLPSFDPVDSNDKNSVATTRNANSNETAGLTRRGLKRKKPIHSNAYFAKRNYEKVISKRFAAQKKEPVEDVKAVVTNATLPLNGIGIPFGINKLGHFKIPKKTDE